MAQLSTHDIYLPATQVQLPQPPLNESNFLYAPTTKGANGSCLEVGTAYVRGNPPQQTLAGVYVQDFCGGPGTTFDAGAGSAFRSDFVTPARWDRPAHYQVANVETATSPPTWTVQFWNVPKREWQIVYSTTGTFMGWGGNGWSMYEQHYDYVDTSSALVACPAGLPPIGARNLAMRTASGRIIRYSPSNAPIYTPLAGETSYGAYGQCFNPTTMPDGSVSPASSFFHLLSPNYSWNVSSLPRT